MGEAYPRIYTIDADLLGHAIYQYNPIVVRNVRNIFGHSTVKLDEREEVVGVDRDELGAVVFSSEERLRTLRSVVSIQIKDLLLEIFSEIEYCHSDKYDMIAVEGAIIIEARTYPLFDELWVTTLDKEEAVHRVLKRNPNLNEL